MKEGVVISMWMEMQQRQTAPNRKQHFGEANKNPHITVRVCTLQSLLVWQ